jgi:cold shock CspA family protein
MLIHHNGTVTASTFSGALSGNATTATELETARTINGVSFDGSGDILVDPYISDDNTGDTSCHLVFTQNSSQGYKRLYEDTGLTYDNTTNKLTATTFSGALDGNATTATELQTARNINGVSFDGSGNITVEPYISDDNTGDTECFVTFTQNGTQGFKRLYEDGGLTYNNTNNVLTATYFNGIANRATDAYISDDNSGDTECFITFTQNSTAGYKRLHEDSGLRYDNSNDRIYTGAYYCSEGGFGMRSFQIRIRQTNNVNYYQSCGYIYNGSHKVFMTATPNGDGAYGNNHFSGLVNKGRFGPADWTDGLNLNYSRYDNSIGTYPTMNWYVQNQGNHGRQTLYVSLYNASTNNVAFYLDIASVGNNSFNLQKSYSNQW